jgi:hypothetical protein
MRAVEASSLVVANGYATLKVPPSARTTADPSCEALLRMKDAGQLTP